MKANQFSRMSFIGLAAALLSVTLASTAGATLLSDLVADQNASVVSGDKVFTKFSTLVNGIGTWTANQIDVTPIQTGADFGIKFATLTGAPILSAGANGAADLLIGFDVTISTDPKYADFLIKDIGLKFDAAAPAEGFAQVVESALAGPTLVAQTSVQIPGGPTQVDIDLPQLTKTIHIVKDAVVIGGRQEGAQIQWIEQTFSQVPEPATLALLGLGLVAFARPRRMARSLLKVAPRLLVLAGLLTVVGAANQAWATPLSTLVQDPANGFAQGDKWFDNFSFTRDGIGTFYANPSAIDVYGLTVSDDEYGIRIAGLMAALSNSASGSKVTIQIGYDVTVTDQLLRIDDIRLGFNGVATAADGSATVTEVVTAIPSGASLATAVADTSNPPTTLNDHEFFSQLASKVHVAKTITLDGGKTGITTISFINQTFSQVPEPTTVGLLALALPVILRGRRRS